MDINSLLIEMEQKKIKSEQELCTLIDSVDSESLLSIMCTLLLLSPPEMSIGDKNGNHPVMLEILASFCIPRFGNNKGCAVSFKNVNKCYSLLEELFFGKLFSKEHFSDGFYSIQSSLKMKTQIVRGSSYTFQITDQIKAILCHFDVWFEKEVNISPSRVLEILYCVLDVIEERFNKHKINFKEAGKDLNKRFINLKRKKNKTDRERKIILELKSNNYLEMIGYYKKFTKVIPKIIPIDIFELPLDERVTVSEYDALKSLVGVSKENFSGDKPIQRSPIIYLNSGEILITHISNCLEVIKDRFEEIAKSNQTFYSKRYQRFKAKWSEKESKRLLSEIFPESTIYETLDYPDPDKINSSAELDMVVKWGPFIIIIEVKSKQFRYESKNGHVGRLRTDIKSNIEDAFNQSLRAIRYISNNSISKFIERETKRELIIEKDKINKIFPISITLENLGELVTELYKTQDLGLFKEKEYPYSVSLADLELITQMGLIPEVFLHYLEKRLYHINHSTNIKGDELDLIETYLDCRLNTKNIQTDGTDDFNMFSFSGYSDRFDKLDLFNRGLYPEKPEFNLNVPPIINSIIKQLKSNNNDSSRWIIFSLLDLDDILLNQISECIEQLKEVNIPNERHRRCSFDNKEVVITIIATTSGSINELKRKVTYRTSIEKYRRKLKKSIGFGIVTTELASDKKISCIQYIEDDWMYDENIEHLLKDEPYFYPVDKSKLPGRNDPCFCGSGMKYKKCCLDKINNSETFRL